MTNTTALKIDKEMEALMARVDRDFAQTKRRIAEILSDDMPRSPGLAGLSTPTGYAESRQNSDPAYDRHLFILQLRAETAVDALFWVLASFEGPVGKSEWAAPLREAGFAEQSIDAARSKLVKLGVISGHYGKYETTELVGYYRSVLHVRKHGYNSEELANKVGEYEAKYGKLFDY